jgi:hypothetical protein
LPRSGATSQQHRISKYLSGYWERGRQTPQTSPNLIGLINASARGVGRHRCTNEIYATCCPPYIRWNAYLPRSGATSQQHRISKYLSGYWERGRQTPQTSPNLIGLINASARGVGRHRCTNEIYATCCPPYIRWNAYLPRSGATSQQHRISKYLSGYWERGRQTPHTSPNLIGLINASARGVGRHRCTNEIYATCCPPYIR